MKKPGHSVAKKLLRLMAGESMPQSQMRQVLIEQMIADGVLVVRSSGSRKTVYCRDVNDLQNYLDNHFGIPNLSSFVVASAAPD